MEFNTFTPNDTNHSSNLFTSNLFTSNTLPFRPEIFSSICIPTEYINVLYDALKNRACIGLRFEDGTKFIVHPVRETTPFKCPGCNKAYQTLSGLISHEIDCKNLKDRYFDVHSTNTKTDTEVHRLQNEITNLKWELNFSNVKDKRIRSLEEENLRLHKEIAKLKDDRKNNVTILNRALSEKDERIEQLEELVKFSISNGHRTVNIQNNNIHNTLIINNILQEKGDQYFEGCKRILDIYLSLEEINSSKLSPYDRMLEYLNNNSECNEDAKIVTQILNPPETLQDVFYDKLQEYYEGELLKLNNESKNTGDITTSIKIQEIIDQDCNK